MKKLKKLIAEEIKKIQINEQISPPADTSCPGGSGCDGEVGVLSFQGDGFGNQMPDPSDPDWVGMLNFWGCTDCGDGNLDCIAVSRGIFLNHHDPSYLNQNYVGFNFSEPTSLASIPGNGANWNARTSVNNYGCWVIDCSDQCTDIYGEVHQNLGFIFAHSTFCAPFYCGGGVPTPPEIRFRCNVKGQCEEVNQTS